MTKEIRLNTVEYTTKDGTTWKANILSEGMDESISLMRDLVPNFDRVHGTNSGMRLDRITPYVKELMTTIKEVEVIKEVKTPCNCDKTKTQEDGFVCPWCDKEFKTLNNMKNHIIKFHLDT